MHFKRRRSSSSQVESSRSFAFVSCQTASMMCLEAMIQSSFYKSDMIQLRFPEIHFKTPVAPAVKTHLKQEI